MTTQRPSARTYTNVALTAIAALLLLNWMGQVQPGLTSANAQPAQPQAEYSPDDASGRISAAEQRKQIVTELKGVSQRLDRIEAALSRGISVKVTDMPAQKPQEPRADKPAGK
jgi:hypothetical protein